MLRSAKITYSDGTVINTSLAGHLTDKEIHDYFKVGKSVNIGNGPLDNMQTVVSCEPAPLRGLTVEVYRSFNRNGSVSDCTAGGVSARVHEITLCGDDLPELFEASEDCPAFRVVRRNLFGSEYIHIEPWERPQGSGWMYGGNIADTSDSRKPWKYPVHIHDRQEF